MCAQRLIANNPPPAPRLFTLRRSLLTSNIQPLTSAFPCAPLTRARAFDSSFSRQSPACPEHRRRVTDHQSHAALSLFAGGWVAIFQFRFSSFQSAGACGDSFFFTDHGSLDTDHQSLTPLKCAVPRFRSLTPLECAVTKRRSRNSFRMRSSEKRWGGGGCPS